MCPSQCLFGKILVTMCLMVHMWDLRVLRVEPMLSCWPNLLFLFVSYFLILFLPWFGFVGLRFSDWQCSHSLMTMHCWLHFNNNNSNQNSYFDSNSTYRAKCICVFGGEAQMLVVEFMFGSPVCRKIVPMIHAFLLNFQIFKF